MENKDKVILDSGSLEAFAEEIAKVENALPQRLNADPENVERGLAQLVLTLVDLLRKLMEKQAMRRLEGDSLTEEEIERLGETLMRLEKKMGELKEIFGLKDEDLNIDLGPLGKLM